MSNTESETFLAVTPLLRTDAVAISDVQCCARCGQRSESECATTTQFIFPYRGLFRRHVGRREMVAGSGQLIVFNADEEYVVSHPIDGGDDCLSIALSEAVIDELIPADQRDKRPSVHLRDGLRPVSTHAQAQAHLLRHRLARGEVDPLEAESKAIALIRDTLEAPAQGNGAKGYARTKLVARIKILLAEQPERRWSLSEIAAEIGLSPVYLTQVFSAVEGISLYQYQLRQRMARALDRLRDAEDLTMLALDLGFSSHSHFTTAFRAHFGIAPRSYRAQARG